jgi:hypothetical protein
MHRFIKTAASGLLWLGPQAIARDKAARAKPNGTKNQCLSILRSRQGAS